MFVHQLFQNLKERALEMIQQSLWLASPYLEVAVLLLVFLLRAQSLLGYSVCVECTPFDPDPDPCSFPIAQNSPDDFDIIYGNGAFCSYRVYCKVPLEGTHMVSSFSYPIFLIQ
jgi:hypothetical protein